ncbi:MAG: insulinase family protein, partial [Ignavibacteria bacterium]|nr:insulinase family protein [Ignavibacteria bacterium]
FQNSSEIAGLFQIEVTAKPEKTLTEMETAASTILSDVLQNGVTENEIEKAITGIEAQVINSATTVQGKAVSLATYYSYTGDPNNINTQMDLFKGMTQSEVLTVAKKYLTQPKMVLSVVPLGKSELAAKKGE